MFFRQPVVAVADRTVWAHPVRVVAAAPRSSLLSGTRQETLHRRRHSGCREQRPTELLLATLLSGEVPPVVVLPQTVVVLTAAARCLEDPAAAAAAAQAAETAAPAARLSRTPAVKEAPAALLHRHRQLRHQHRTAALLAAAETVVRQITVVLAGSVLAAAEAEALPREPLVLVALAAPAGLLCFPGKAASRLAGVMSDPTKADCHTTYTAVHHSGLRPLTDIWWIVMHDTEGGTAESVARYFTEPAAGGSTQLVVDDDHCYRTLANNMVPWGAPGANQNGFHIEQCGYASWTSAEWRTHQRMLERGAFKAAYHCHLFKLPVVFVNAAGLLAHKKGITTHAECTKAFGPAGGHTDPGPGWPRLVFMGLVKTYYDDLVAKP